ncbi:MAG TPA: lipoate--protein ligase, partial [Bacteroidales bacterium]|nr:lipoate--protein ligase [Bacteroidales bacterium]
MKTIINNSLDASFWFALEEYVMKTEKFCDEYFLFWNTVPTLMIGRFQNTLQEINADFVRNNNMQVIRRNSGGGTIYTDPATWQFSFITWKQQGEAKDFKEFTKPVIEALQQLGVPAEFNNRNDILAGGKKFSGNAQAVRRNRILHHGTLLFDTDLNMLSTVLAPGPGKLIGKGIDSVRSRVTNLRPLLKNDMTTAEFLNGLASFFLDSGCDSGALSKKANGVISALRRTKYGSHMWTYGENPAYEFFNEDRFPCGEVTVGFDCSDGRISGLKIGGDFLLKRSTREL